MRLLGKILFGVALNGAALWAQAGSPSGQPVPAMAGLDSSSDSSDDRMQTPPQVSGQAFPAEVASEERSNYLRGGIAFTSAYTDNAVGPVNGYPVSDISTSVAPLIALDETTSRLHWTMNYAPGFTFYQRETSRNESDQNAAIDFRYRLSPHVTLSAHDSLQKSSSMFNETDLASAQVVSGNIQQPNFSVIAPIASLLRNSGNVGLNYQFALNGMIGVNGSFSNQHYPNASEVTGLFDSASQGGSVFYSLRISNMHYLGATYQYQRLISYPGGSASETQTHAVMAMYTLFPTSRISISFFGGPQYSDTIQPSTPPLQMQSSKAWTPAAGASASWQLRLTNFALSYSHIISGGGGLIGAVHMDSAAAYIRQQITKNFNASVGGSYVQNNVLGALPGTNNGHTLSGTAALQHQVGQRLSVQLGYNRIHQDYGGVAVLSATPNTNREFVSISYQFARPLGR